MVNDLGSGRVQTYTFFEGRCPIYKAVGYCGERIQAHYVIFHTMIGIGADWAGERGQEAS